MISTFPSRKYLMNALTASCYIPVYSMGYFANAPQIDNVVKFFLNTFYFLKF